MDWNLGSGSNDLMVPMDDELSDVLMSAESWSMWSPTAPEGFGLPKKYFMMDQHPNSTLHYGFCNEFEVKSVYGRNQSSCSSDGGELLEESFHQGLLLHDHQDYQLDGFSGIEEMDEIFLYKHTSWTLNVLLCYYLIEPFTRSGSITELCSCSYRCLWDSLLEDAPGNKDLHRPFCFSSESHCRKISAAHTFTPSMGWEKGEVSGPLFIPCNSEQEDPVIKALSVKIFAPHDESSSDVHVAEQASLEESVLQDLERVMAQLTKEARICFRDSFYRLAKNSEQQSVSHTQHAISTKTSRLCTSKDEKIGSGRKKAVESETNIIDRTIANLTFNKRDSTAQSFQATESGNSNQEITRGT